MDFFLTDQYLLVSLISCSMLLYMFSSFVRAASFDVAYTDFTKAFDSIDHGTLLYILDGLGIGDPLLT